MSINIFKHPIIDGIVDPEDQPVLDKYVVQRGIGASSVRYEDGRKQGSLHTVTLENGDKVEALWRGQRDLEDHTDKNLIKQTTSNGNTRYYMLVDRVNNKTIKDIVDMYVEYVSQNMATHIGAERYKFDSFIKFRDNFDTNSENFEEMLSRALPRNNLDSGGNYFPSKMLQVFANENPEAVRGALKILSDSSLSVEERVGRYHTSMLELLENHNRTTSRDDSGADDTRFISLLLSMINPSEFMNYKSTQLKPVYRAVYGDDKNLDGKNVDKIIKAKQFGKELLAEFRSRSEFQEIKQKIAWDIADDNLWLAQDIYWVVSRMLKKPAKSVDIIPILKRFIAQAVEGVDFTRKQYSEEIAPGIDGYAVFQSQNKALPIPFLIFGNPNSRSVVNEPYIGFLYLRDRQKVALIYSWQAPPEEQLDIDRLWRGAGYKLQFNEDSYDEVEINDRFNQLLTELKVKVKSGEESMDIKAHEHPLNVIYYGPPGTGKTYYVNEIKRLLIGGQRSEARDPLAGIKTWNDAIVRVFADNNYRPLSVNDILHSEIMQAYAATRNSKSPYGTISTQILGNATAESTSSAYRLGTDKYEKVDGKWALTEAGRAEAEAMASTVEDAELGSSTEDKFFKFTTFHQSYGYEEFMEGIRPETDEGTGQLRYEIRDGVFKEFCARALRDHDNKYLFVIDEINRANISKVFGELITLLEPSKRIGAEEELRVSLPYSGESFGVPANVYIVGTMNTADRSIALLDIALRRRFDFIEIMPQPELLSSDVDGVNLQKLLSAVNSEVVRKIDRNHQIGHSYLMQIDNLDELHRAWYRRVVPLLQEYFYDDTDDLRSVIKSFVDNDEIITMEGEDFRTALKSIYEETQNQDSGIQL